MKSIYEIVTHLEATSGKNDKLAYLKENANDDIKEFFYLALEPTILFYIKKIPAYTPDSKAPTSIGDVFYDLVNKVSNRKVTGDAARDLVADLLSRLTAEEAAMVERVILKDPRVGMSEKTINKVWKGLVTEKLYMRCAAFNEKNLAKIKYPALVQLKADGLFVNIICKNGTVTFLSRNMRPIELLGNLEDEVRSMAAVREGRIVNKDNTVLHGEFLVRKADDSGYEDRKTGNGIINKAIKGTISQAEADRIHVKVWDMLPLDSWKKGVCDFPYEIRIKTLEANLPETPKIKIIKTKLVRSLDEAYDFFNAMLAKGQEGAILKNLNGIWKNHTSPNQVKMKKKDPADLICTGTYAFKEQYVMRGSERVDTSKWIGGLNLESSDGKIKVNSGSGLTDKTRAKPPEYYIGKVIEVEYNEIIGNKNDDQLSLFLPIIKEVREDKDEADSYDRILERQK